MCTVLFILRTAWFRRKVVIAHLKINSFDCLKVLQSDGGSAMLYNFKAFKILIFSGFSVTPDRNQNKQYHTNAQINLCISWSYWEYGYTTLPGVIMGSFLEETFFYRKSCLLYGKFLIKWITHVFWCILVLEYHILIC